MFGGAILCIAPFANKFLVELFALLTLTFLVVGLLKASGKWLLLWRIAGVLWLLSLLSPLDVILRSGGTISIRWVRVVYGADASLMVRRTLPESFVENRNYVNYPSRSLLIPCRSALLLTLPTSLKIKTPICSFLMDAPNP
jgi:hypothetical protein